MTNREQVLTRVPGRVPGGGTGLLLTGLVLLVAFGVLYAPVFLEVVGQWMSNDLYSYGILVPGLSAWLVWARRDRLGAAVVGPSYLLGVPVLAVGLAMLVAGRAGGIESAEALSMVVTLAGGILLLLGKAVFRVIAVPIAYLLLMLPIWEVFTSRLHLPFQLFSAEVGVALLQMLGVPAYQQETVIELPRIVLEVAQACSGVNYLVAVIAIGLPLAYLFLEGWVPRVLLIVLGVGIAVIGNAVRVTLIGLLAHYGFAGDVHGPYHVLQGLFVSMTGYAALFVGLALLRRRGALPQDEPVIPAAARTTRRVAPPASVRGHVGRGLAVAAAFAVVAGLVGRLGLEPRVLGGDLRALPLSIGEWLGATDVSEYPEIWSGGADDQLLRRYQTADGGLVRLYVGYYSRQAKGKELINYRARHVDREAAPLIVATPDGRSVELRVLVRRDGVRHRLMIFWYDLGGRVVSDPYAVKALTVWNAIRGQGTNGAVIVLTADVTATSDIERLSARTVAFARDLLPILHRYLSVA